jgi:hypothetical protein
VLLFCCTAITRWKLISLHTSYTCVIWFYMLKIKHNVGEKLWCSSSTIPDIANLYYWQFSTKLYEWFVKLLILSFTDFCVRVEIDEAERLANVLVQKSSETRIFRFFFHGWTAVVGLGLLIVEVRDHTPSRSLSLSLSHTHTESVGLLWTIHLTKHNTRNRQTSMTPVGFEPAIPANERPQTHALHRAATGIGNLRNYEQKFNCFI